MNPNLKKKEKKNIFFFWGGGVGEGVGARVNQVFFTKNPNKSKYLNFCFWGWGVYYESKFKIIFFGVAGGARVSDFFHKE